MKAALQKALAHWGRPERMRFDNGTPWGPSTPAPSALALWLVGLGIQPVFGRPAHCTDNAYVERSHGVLNQWVEPSTCTSVQVCAEHLAWAVDTQRSRYPFAKGQTRLAAFPALLTNPRTYDPRTEADSWSMQPVIAYLAQFHFQRKVEKFGQITLFANTYSIGRAFSRQSVDLALDPLSRAWVVSDDYGREIRRLPARELTYALISQLQLAKRRKCRKSL